MLKIRKSIFFAAAGGGGGGGGGGGAFLTAITIVILIKYVIQLRYINNKPDLHFSLRILISVVYDKL